MPGEPSRYTYTPPASSPLAVTRLSAESAVSALSFRSDEGEDEEAEEEVLVTPALLRMVAVAGLGGLLFGFDTGICAAILVVLGQGLGGKELTTFQQEWAVSSALVGALVGSLAAGQLADWWGRKKTLLLGALLFALGAVEQAAAQVYKEFVLGRVLVGIAVGLSSHTIPIYLAELSPAKYRGRLVASLVVLITGGQLLAYLVGTAATVYYSAICYDLADNWRWMAGLGAVPAVAQLLLAATLPDSPRWLIEHDRVAPARKIFRSIYQLASEATIQRKIERIQNDIAEDKAETLRGLALDQVKDTLTQKLWRDRGNRKALILACGLQFFQQATGFNTLLYFSGLILQSAGFANPIHFAIIIAASNFICTIIALQLIDRLGRRPLLLYTLVGMVFGMFFLGLSFLFIRVPSDPSDVVKTGAWGYISLMAMAFFCCSYALGIGNCPWVVQSEVFSHDLRSYGTGFATATNWLANLIVSATFLHLSEAITPTGTFWLYSLIAIAGWIFTFYFLPETKGLTLEETRALFVAAAQNNEDRGGYEVVDANDEVPAGSDDLVAEESGG